MRKNDIRTLPDGSHFYFKGFKWIALDNNVDGGVLAVMASSWNGERYRFDEDYCNNYAESSLRKKLRDELLPVLGEDNLIPHEIDLVADNGDGGYGKISDKVFILSCDEYRKYRKHVPLIHEWMWTCTPWGASTTTYLNSARSVSETGYLYSEEVNEMDGILPACVFNPEKVKVGYTIPTVEERSND